ncbi:MAG: sugar transferase [Bryobacterales bacterium]|nr:sugar transferase [Bryobacterales bacterium]MBV9018567.1 sugar transferase [Alphaproteobacteria bacterium]MBV9151139.1 sugar transferase [Alphaproteobacteria bacterium]MBV9964608.1 sugar transferase [Alphaproteobacteria bacterium]
MQEQAAAHFAPDYLVDEGATQSTGFSSYDALKPTTKQKTEARQRQISIIRTASAVGGGRKRGFDIAAAGLSLLLLLPLFCVIALAVKLSDRGPIIYRHRRIGRNGRRFYCLKFRTMVPDADTILHRHLAANPRAASEWSACQKLTQDPRITALGLVLRKTSLDELPQLWNIIRGEMSVVGPRPIVSAETVKYGDTIEQYMGARPGLTGLWQISGRNDVGYERRVALDRRYVEEWSIGLDLRIILKTVVIVLSSRGCY